MRVHELASRLSADFEGDGEAEVMQAAELGQAGPGDLAFVGGRKFLALAAGSRAACLIVPMDFPRTGETVIRTADPRALFAQALGLLYPVKKWEPGVHPTALVGEGTEIGEGVAIGPYTVIGSGCRIGAKTVLEAHVVLGDDVEVGEGSLLRPQVRVYSGVKIGRRALLHSGAVLGADGFGFAMVGGAYRKFPQVGTVELGDDVEIGANACIDRAALGKTIIGDGTKLDNMVHIAHNCRIGKHVVIAAQTGISGGVVVEDYAVIGGQVGIGDKARIESRAVLGSGSGVLTAKIVRGGQTYWGTPARPLKEYLAQLAQAGRVGELLEEVRALRRRLDPKPEPAGAQIQSPDDSDRGT